MARIIFPIWKDTPIKIATMVDSVNYVVYEYAFGQVVNKQEIYSGKAYARPSQGFINVTLNDIVGGLFLTALPFIENEITGWGLNFRDTYYSIQPEGGAEIEFQPIWDYTYNGNTPVEDLQDRILIRPLRRDGTMEVDYRQFVATSQQVTAPSDMTYNYDGIDYVAVSGASSIDAGFDLRGLPYSDRLYFTNDIGTIIYKVVQSCCRYCLHYVNKIGGWESVLMNGKHSDREAYTRKTIIVNGLEQNYHTDIEKTWNLSRILMVDGEGLNVSEIVGSSNLVLEDLEADGAERFKYVVMQTSEAVEKDYSNNGNQFVQLDIVVKESQPRQRR